MKRNIFLIIIILLINWCATYYILYQNFQVVKIDSKMYLNGYSKGYSEGTTYGMQSQRYWDNLNPENSK